MYSSLLRHGLKSSIARTVVGSTVPMTVSKIGLNATKTAISHFSASAFSLQDKKPQDKILTDDLLAKAGFDDEPAEGKKDDEDRRERRKRRNQTSKDKQREKAANYFYISSFATSILGAGYLSRDWDDEEEQKKLGGEDIGNGYDPKKMYGRMSTRLSSLFTIFSDPVFENLLPPPAPEPYRRPLTLVLTLDDLLIHSDWDTKNGWRTGKRPGLDYFLGYLSQYYEIVIFGSNSQIFSEKTVAKLDPYHAFVSYALFKEACRYKDGKLIKDLSLLNRDLSKVILVDIDEESWTLQPDNAIPMEKWDGKPDDRLIKLIPFLEFLATQNVKDVRPVLKSFDDKYKLIEEYQERENRLRAQWNKENQHLVGNRPNAGNFLAKMMGLPTSSVSKGSKMPLDVIREHGQLQYQQFQVYLKENAAKFLEEEQKMKEEFGKATLNKWMEGGPNPEEIAQIQKERAAAAAAEGK